jgi:hypothetical protein
MPLGCRLYPTHTPLTAMAVGVMSKGIRAEDRTAWGQRGGRVRIDSKGRPVYVIHKQIGGRRLDVSTRKHTLPAALAE